MSNEHDRVHELTRREALTRGGKAIAALVAGGALSTVSTLLKPHEASAHGSLVQVNNLAGVPLHSWGSNNPPKTPRPTPRSYGA